MGKSHKKAGLFKDRALKVPGAVTNSSPFSR